MKNFMKKLMALLLALVLCLTMSVAVFATGDEGDPETPATATPESGDASITITRDPSYAEGPENVSGNETYTYYRILFATYADGDLGTVNSETGELDSTGKVAYYVTSETEATALQSLKVKNASNEDVSLFTVTPTTGGNRWNVSLAYADASAAQIAEALYTIKDNFPNQTVTRDGANDVEIENVAKGYYLITSSLGSKLAVQTLGEVTIKEKNTYPTADKKQGDISDSYSDEKASVQVGDTIYYSIEVNVPATANGDIIITDTMSTGLTYDDTTGLTWAVDSGSITENTDYEIVTTPDPTTATWQVKIHPTANTLGRTITITYQATVNKDALTDSDKKNEAILKYSNYEQKDTVEFETYATGMIKYDGDKAEVVNDIVQLKSNQTGTYLLPDAEFKLQVKIGDEWVDMDVYQENGYYRPMNGDETAATIKSDANGEIIIRGLDSDKEYQLVETKAPSDGYNLATSPVTLTLTLDSKAGVTITEDASETVTKLSAASVGKLENNKGTQLPSTGGIGTTILYIVGGILVVGAAVLLITRRRMNVK